MPERPVNFLFWNVNNQPRSDVLARLARTHRIDVVILTECWSADAEFLSTLRRGVDAAFHKPWCSAECSKIALFSRLPENAVQPIWDDVTGRLTIRKLVLDDRGFLLAAAHLQSKANWDERDQADGAQDIARRILKAEEESGHQRTVLVGDLNMNPFDHGAISSHGLHAVMTRQLASQGGRKVAGQRYPFFYNPMWGCFGDRTPGPAGTYFYRTGRPGTYFWNMYDQVLIRPDLLDTFRDDLRILDSDGSVSLVKADGRPDASVGSDHLPLTFRLYL